MTSAIPRPAAGPAREIRLNDLLHAAALEMGKLAALSRNVDDVLGRNDRVVSALCASHRRELQRLDLLRQSLEGLALVFQTLPGLLDDGIMIDGSAATCGLKLEDMAGNLRGEPAAASGGQDAHTAPRHARSRPPPGCVDLFD